MTLHVSAFGGLEHRRDRLRGLILYPRRRLRIVGHQLKPGGRLAIGSNESEDLREATVNRSKAPFLPGQGGGDA